LVSEINLNTVGSIADFSIADIKRDGNNYIVFNSDNKIFAVNFYGAVADNFPFTINKGTFTGQVLSADFDGDGFIDLMSTTDAGLIYCVSGNTGKLIKGFPISSDGNKNYLHTAGSGEGIDLYSISNKNNLRRWNIKRGTDIRWSEESGNSLNTFFAQPASIENQISEFFPPARTYNWPNPVYESITYIRSFVAEDSKIKIKIFDLAGDLVNEMEYNASGGTDNEIAWDVSAVQSGVYFARVEVNSKSGKTDSKIIKIAVVK
jgi:WD40 repeat protein